jgi:hypothetical protein
MKRFLFNLFKEDFLRFAFDSQAKPIDFENLEMKFIDSNGKKYYSFSNDDDIPLLRKGRLETHLKELQMGLSSGNIDEILNYMERALNKGQSPDIAKIGHAIVEIRNRKNLLIHPEIMFNLVSVLYIREDETPGKIDEEIHAQKVDQFKKDSQGGLYDFFYNSGLSVYIPYIESLKNDWMEFWEAQKARVEAFSLLCSSDLK